MSADANTTLQQQRDALLAGCSAMVEFFDGLQFDPEDDDHQSLKTTATICRAAVELNGGAVPTPEPAIESKYGPVVFANKVLHPGEPVFLLRATDPLAPEAIEEYADLCNMHGCHADHIYACRRQADRIRAWQKANPSIVKKLPD